MFSHSFVFNSSSLSSFFIYTNFLHHSHIFHPQFFIHLSFSTIQLSFEISFSSTFHPYVLFMNYFHSSSFTMGAYYSCAHQIAFPWWLVQFHRLGAGALSSFTLEKVSKWVQWQKTQRKHQCILEMMKACMQNKSKRDHNKTTPAHFSAQTRSCTGNTIPFTNLETDHRNLQKYRLHIWSC